MGSFWIVAACLYETLGAGDLVTRAGGPASTLFKSGVLGLGPRWSPLLIQALRIKSKAAPFKKMKDRAPIVQNHSKPRPPATNNDFVPICPLSERSPPYRRSPLLLFRRAARNLPVAQGYNALDRPSPA